MQTQLSFLFYSGISLTLFFEKATAVRKLARRKDQSLTRFWACWKKPANWLFMPTALS